MTTTETIVTGPSPISGKGFTHDEASRGAQASNAIQETNRRQLYRNRHDAYQLVKAVELGEIGQAAYETALQVIEAIATRAELGLPLDESIDIYRAAQVAETIFKIHRLATGQSTSNNAHAAVSADDVASKLAELQARTTDAQSTVTHDETTVTPS